MWGEGGPGLEEDMIPKSLLTAASHPAWSAIEVRVSGMVSKGLLVHLGCDVMTVSSADECLRIVSEEHKVVFMDVPGIDSYEVAIHIREKFTNHYKRPLIVALTGNTDRVTKENCMRFGMDGVIMKPVSVDKLRSVLLELLEDGVLFEAK
ncbi:hypothetical protein TEA_028711 [Camellia sinensis var. sinensis]|uniref:Response regulatory domain-containing protein n=1 Tax=Camellia sinensis var. sinensis TaxID=542762 RepID=A0A4S4EAG1_CAMSN|nr:hypothetical protein TEA_028711 [Camellia sinensis var. sinensis]